jgi:hypothetical protein
MTLTSPGPAEVRIKVRGLWVLRRWALLRTLPSHSREILRVLGFTLSFLGG